MRHLLPYRKAVVCFKPRPLKALDGSDWPQDQIDVEEKELPIADEGNIYPLKV
ncbi:hypothetical protein AMTRI_Chr13g122880 [Amborella trichopoda]